MLTVTQFNILLAPKDANEEELLGALESFLEGHRAAMDLAIAMPPSLRLPGRLDVDLETSYL